MSVDSATEGRQPGQGATMRAYAIDGFGQPGRFRELPVPEPGEGELLIRTKAAGVSTTDLAVMAGWMKDYFEHVFPLIPGIDVSGVVERVGPGVEGFAVGDEVFGYVRGQVMGRGTFAEFTKIDTGAAQHKPASLTHEQAATIAHAALTAAATIDAAAVKPGDRVVLLGATGGVGSFATQLATAAGADVIAVTLAEHAAYARSLGATETFDYTDSDPVEEVKEKYPDGTDALIDLVGMPQLSAGMAGLVHTGGHVVSVIMPPDVEALAERGVTGLLTTRIAAEDQFPKIAKGITDGEIKVPEIREFPFDEVEAALALQATRHVRGKSVLVVDGGAGPD